MSHTTSRNTIRHTAVLALLLGLAAVPPEALAQLRPASAITDSFRSISALFAGRLILAFDSIPANTYSFAPTAQQQTYGYIAQHLVAANYALCSRFGGVPLPVVAEGPTPDTVKAKWPKDTLVVRLRASFAYCASAFAQVNDANLAEEMPIGGTGGQSQQRARSLLLYATDLAEHYSQVASYMRINGLVPPSALPPARRTAITLPASVLSRYVGIYNVAASPLLGYPAVLLEITLNNGALFVKPAGQPAAQLWPETETNFFLKEVDAQLSFTRNAAGTVSGLVLRQNGEVRLGSKE